MLIRSLPRQRMLIVTANSRRVVNWLDFTMAIALVLTSSACGAGFGRGLALAESFPDKLATLAFGVAMIAGFGAAMILLKRSRI